MQDIKIATAQFENASGDKAYNLSVIEKLAAQAKAQGAEVVCFHELSVTGYTFMKDLDREQMWALAEAIPDGPSTQRLIEISRKHDIAILAGVLEKEGDAIYKAQVCVDTQGLVAKYRKLHPFINPHIRPGNEYVVFDLRGWKCSILICYDLNVIENVRAVALLGAQILFAPHVTMCTPSTRPGAGFVDPALWENRERDPAALRMEFDGPKGRQWLMRWLPARAYDNGIYIVFSNPIGMDSDQLKNGCAMILDPFGEVLTEIRSFEDTVAVATCIPEKLTQAGGHRYRNARRPELYGKILAQEHRSVTQPIWLQPGEPQMDAR